MTITPYVPPSWISSLPSGIWSGVAGYPVFPVLPGQYPTVKKTPQWSTNVKRASSGRERRTGLWSYPLWNFELSYEVIRHRPTIEELAVMWEFFNVAQGKLATFLLVDMSANQVTGQQFATGDGTTTTFQLTRQIRSWVEPVFGVYSPTIYVNGTPTSAYTIIPNGACQFTTAPASGAVLTWSGYFYFGCRFDQDDCEFEQIVSQLWQGKSIKLVSQRP